MKATLWLWSAVTALVCVSLQVSALPYSDTRVIQENSLLSLKRTKPSLSIVNPLDVLRQRIILEMARRQMRENTRQVELNKALLREIGKRSSNFYDGPENPLDYTYYERKPYAQRVAPDPERSPVEDELEAMVESLLRSSQRNYGGKLQRVRSVSQEQRQAAAASNHPTVEAQDQVEAQSQLASQSQQQLQQQQQQQQPQQSPLGSLFNNEQERLHIKGYQEQGSHREEEDVDDDHNNNDDGNGEGVADGEDDPSTRGRSSALKALQAGDSFLDTSPDGQPKLAPAADERNTVGDFRPQFVYGMYKNRYAN